MAASFAAGPDRRVAFEHVRRHSRLVKRLRVAIVAGSLLTVLVLVGAAFVDPFGKVPGNVSIASASLNGTKITMELPRLDGFRKDGKPYQVRARSGVQDVRNPKVIELNEVEARIQVEQANTVNVIAPAGIFDSGADQMKLLTRRAGETITLKSTSGFNVILQEAEVNLKAGSLQSSKPVVVQMPSGSIESESMRVSENAKVIIFDGNVRSLFRSRDDTNKQDTDLRHGQP